MSKRLVIEIIKDKQVIGSCLYDWYGTLLALFKAKDIIDNYNKNLINSKLKKELLAIRMFQEEDEDASINKNLPKVYQASRDFLINTYPSFDLKEKHRSVSFSYGKIAIASSDIKSNLYATDSKLSIDLDSNIISLIELSYNFEYDDYCERMNYDPDKFNKNDLKIIDVDLEWIPFNAIEDTIDFIVENEDGWLDKFLPDYICQAIS